MLHFVRTTSEHPDFVALVRLLDADLTERYGIEQSFYAQFNKIDRIGHVILAYEHGQALSCGALRPYGEDAMEVKRMYTLPEARNRGIAALVLRSLEDWAHELGFARCVLETGKKQPEAIRLYEKSGYHLTANYGQYADVENSVCFEKIL